jgi:hypothetical protein
LQEALTMLTIKIEFWKKVWKIDISLTTAIRANCNWWAKQYT